jgi:hypothetical protein
MKCVVVLLSLLAYSYAQNADCALLLPTSPLTPQGLATPYQLQALNAANGPCNQANNQQTSFVQGVIYDNTVAQPNFAVYNPIVVDAGTTPAIALVAPQLNAGVQIGLWFGSNANTLTLLDGGLGGFAAGSCVNGLVIGAATSIFGQFSYCNAQNFFVVALNDMKQGLFTPPALGTAIDGAPCPTTRDYFVVDQDPADNVVTTYLIVKANGKVALNTTQNIATLGGGNVIFAVNPSDERLIGAINNALGCKNWLVRDLNDVQNVAGVYSYGTNEIFAAYWQGRVPGMSPPALIPLNDPMARDGQQISLPKVNAYRAGAGQTLAVTSKDADSITYCRNMLIWQPGRMLKNINALYSAPSPSPTVATSLLAFLAQRFVAAFGLANLQCTALLQVPMPMNLTLNGNGLVTGAVIMPYTMPGSGPVITPPRPVGAATSVQFNIFLLLALVLLTIFRM